MDNSKDNDLFKRSASKESVSKHSSGAAAGLREPSRSGDSINQRRGPRGASHDSGPGRSDRGMEADNQGQEGKDINDEEIFIDSAKGSQHDRRSKSRQSLS